MVPVLCGNTVLIGIDTLVAIGELLLGTLLHAVGGFDRPPVAVTLRRLPKAFRLVQAMIPVARFLVSLAFDPQAGGSGLLRRSGRVYPFG